MKYYPNSSQTIKKKFIQTHYNFYEITQTHNAYNMIAGPYTILRSIIVLPDIIGIVYRLIKTMIKIKPINSKTIPIIDANFTVRRYLCCPGFRSNLSHITTKIVLGQLTKFPGYYGKIRYGFIVDS